MKQYKKSSWYYYNQLRKKRGEEKLSFEEYCDLREKGTIHKGRPLKEPLSQEEIKERNRQRSYLYYHNSPEYKKKKIARQKIYKQTHKEQERQYRRISKERLKADPEKYRKFLDKQNERRKRKNHRKE